MVSVCFGVMKPLSLNTPSKGICNGTAGYHMKEELDPGLSCESHGQVCSSLDTQGLLRITCNMMQSEV